MKRFFHGKTLILFLVFGLIVCKQLFFIVIIPPWQNHDEPAHFHYAQYIVEEHHIPLLKGEFKSRTLSFSEEYGESEQILDLTRLMKGSNVEFRSLHQRFSSIPDNNQINAHLSGLGRSPLYGKIVKQNYAQLYYQLPESDLYANSASIYQPLYYLYIAIPYALFNEYDIVSRLYVMRIFSSLLFLGAVILSYLIAKKIFNRFLPAVVVTLIVGLQPVYGHLMTGLNNDAMLIFLTTILLYLVLKLLDSPSHHVALWLGIITGLGLLTKPQFIVFPILLIIPLYYHWRHQKLHLRKIVQFVIIVCLTAFILSGWWYVYTYLQNNNPILQTLVEQVKQTPNANYILFFYLYRWIYEFATYNFIFGFASTITLPLGIMFSTTILYCVALLGWIKERVYRKKKVGLKIKYQNYILFTGVILLEVLLLYLFSKNVLIKGTARFPIDGRYMMPVVVNIAIITVYGVQKIIPARFQKTAWMGIAVLFVITAFFTLFYTTSGTYYL